MKPNCKPGTRLRDLEYQAKVDLLIEYAAKITLAVVGVEPLKTVGNGRHIRQEWVEWAQAWDREFHAVMDYECTERKIRRQSHQNEG